MNTYATYDNYRKILKSIGYALNKNKTKYFSYFCQEKTRCEQGIETLAFTGHASFYAAILEDIDPSAIPFVDYFKTQLKKGH